MHYFAYGSNLSTARFKARLPAAQLFAKARLPGYELRFHKVSTDGSGKCDIVPSSAPGAVVHGVVYRISPEERQTLDRIEGVGVGYRACTLSVLTSDDRTMEVLTYRATRVDGALRPYSWYHAFVLAGATEHGFPDDYLKSIRSIPVITDPDRARHRRNQRILQTPAGED